jgi:hypothetical protein
MNTKINTCLATLLALGLIGAASAESAYKPSSTATNQRCEQLIAQFDSAKASHTTAKNYSKALSARETGASQCKAGEYSKGIVSLDNALRDIDVKPVAHKT